MAAQSPCTVPLTRANVRRRKTFSITPWSATIAKKKKYDPANDAPYGRRRAPSTRRLNRPSSARNGGEDQRGRAFNVTSDGGRNRQQSDELCGEYLARCAAAASPAPGNPAAPGTATATSPPRAVRLPTSSSVSSQTRRPSHRVPVRPRHGHAGEKRDTSRASASAEHQEPRRRPWRTPRSIIVLA